MNRLTFRKSFSIIFVCFNICYAQISLQWLNRTGTNADSLYDSRVYFHADHLYGPITKYHYYPYSNYDNEFELRRLKERHREYKHLIDRIWRTGFLLQIPMATEGQTDINSIAYVGKYSFTEKNFPLKFKDIALEFPLGNDEADLDNLLKQVNNKQKRFTELGRVLFKLRYSSIPQKPIILNVPKEYAETFKESVINGMIGIEIIVEFYPNSTERIEQNETSLFKEYMAKFSYPISKQEGYERYAKSHNITKPLELSHTIELKYKILGFRIVDGDHLVLFEWHDEYISSAKWSIDSLLIHEDDIIRISEKQITNSFFPHSENPWFRQAIISSFMIEKNAHTIDAIDSSKKVSAFTLDNNLYMNEVKNVYGKTELFTSWWDCDLYLKMHGKRMPSLVELSEAALQCDYLSIQLGLLKLKYGRYEITSTRGNYIEDFFDFNDENGRTLNDRLQKKTSGRNFWGQELARFRGVVH